MKPDDLVRFRHMIEAAARVSPEARSHARDAPWSALVGMHNRLIQAYFDIDRDLVWTAVTEEVPPLLPRLRSLESGD